MKKSEALKILGLSDGTSDEDIKKAHRQKVRENHPDQFADPEKKKTAEEKTKLINEARDVLLSRKWDPESGPRTGGYGNPYANPYTSYRPNQSGYQQGGSGTGQGNSNNPYGEDPFAGWPFDFVWTSWDDIGTDQNRGAHANGANPFDPFSSTYTQAPTKTPAEEAAEAQHDRRTTLTAIALKAGVLALCAAVGALAIGIFLYIVITLLMAVFREIDGCSGFLILPAVIVLGPSLAMFMPSVGSSVSMGALIFLGMAVAYDIGAVRKASDRYNTAKERAKVAQ